MFKDGILYSSYKDDIIPDIEEKTAVEFLLNSVSKVCSKGQGGKSWLTNVETGELCRFDQVETITRQVASGMFKRGMRSGDALLYSAHEPTRLHAFILGVWRANGVTTAAYAEESAATHVALILESKIKWVICEPAKASELLPLLKEQVSWPVEVICFANPPEGCTSAKDIMEDDGLACPEFTRNGNDIAAILPTSGTTGASKGTLFSQQTLANIFKAYEMGFYYCDLDRTITMGRATHISGFCIPFGILPAGMQLYSISVVTKQNILESVQRYRPQAFFGFHKFILYLTEPEAEQYDLSSIEIVSTGGFVITPSFIKIINSKLGVGLINGYAMTECPSLTSTRDYDPTLKHKLWEDHPDFSVGKLVPRTMLQVRDLDTGAALGPNQHGELFFKNNLVCSGYLNKPEETKNGFPDGWVQTGDVGYFDENGYVFVVDRIKEMFKYITNQISPSELEGVIQRHPAVSNVCVVGFVDPGGDTVPRAFVTLKDPNASADEIRRFADGQVAPFKKLRGGLIVMHELPIGKSGKFDRKTLSKIQISIPTELERS